MSWAIGYDTHWKRDVGYSVPAYCDHPGCGKEIDRGLAFVCGGAPFGGDRGCGLYICQEHAGHADYGVTSPYLCERCVAGEEPFSPTPDHPDWIHHKLTHKSWKLWRDEHPEEVCFLRGSRA